MYRVIVHKRVYLDTSQVSSVLLERELDLPFVPFLGLSLVQGAWTAEPLTRVCWLPDEQLFSCETSSLFPKPDDEYSMNQHVEFLLMDGWKGND
jgi:hypothetical protein